ncbi:hypothetical protein HD598_000842 [Neomicrococcus aestuarii]|uniref:Uncharacterized protein n=1 Tax=Neomicrococcus aestuarii TaxID=556325 RepID=A0A7W8TU66_9MICC|nr:hypothetical protein [Neomicrococcus aestuarii]MBB5512155.1 hypothetical protein [Neomicrococcus aestuarii]
MFFQKQLDAATASLHARLSGRAKPLCAAGEMEDSDAEEALVDSHAGLTARQQHPEQGGGDAPGVGS